MISTLMKKISSFFLLVLIPFVTVNGYQNSDPKSGMEVLSMMYDKYEGKWYKNLTFTQETVFYGPKEEVVRTQTWFESMALPGKLAIKFDSKDSGNGILFKDGVQYGYANGEKIQEVRLIHDLLVLGFDVYHQPVDSTISKLQSNGYDLSKLYKDEWQGRDVYVIGVNEKGSTEPQFWIDRERLVFVRNITLGRQNTVQEVQFNNYEKLGEGWIAPEVVFKANGKMGLLEKYTDMIIPDTLNQAIFDPEKFVEATWE